VLKQQFPTVPMLAVTATATDEVLADVCSMLRIVGCVRFRAAVNRPNLFYEVREKKASAAAALADVAGFIQTYAASEAGIVYCISRKECETVAGGLAQLGVKAAHYHADMDPKWRAAVHSQWSAGEVQVVRTYTQNLTQRLRVWSFAPSSFGMLMRCV
jgi:ATP-dependent DNA helicase Q1